MAVNKNKVVALAQRYTAKGQLEKAVAEYRKLVQADPSDIRTWLKIGDLYTRMGARKEATETYIRVAEQYTNSGFHLKAIAVYKQILNIDPTLVTIHQYLAASYLELGLTSEALIQLEQLADVYERTGRDDAFLDILMRMGKIDPHNIATRLRIAELYSKQNRVTEAASHFSLACDELKNQGRREDFIKVAERLLYHDSTRDDIAQEMAAIYLERGRYKEALAKLQICFAKAPKDTGVLSLLASAFDGLGQPEKAISVYVEIAEILKEKGELARRQRILKEILALDPNHEMALAEVDDYVRPAGEESGYPEDDIVIDSDDTMEGIEIWDSEDTDQRLSPEELAAKSTERLGEVHVLIKYGLKERALDHLGKIFEIDPYNIDARELAKDLLLELEREDEALQQLFLLAEAFQASQPEGSIYYLHEILKIDRDNQRARRMIRDLGGIMPEGLSDDPGDMVEVEEEILLLDEDEDVVLIDNDDLVEADAILSDDNAAVSDASPDWNALGNEAASRPSAADNVNLMDDELSDQNRTASFSEDDEKSIAARHSIADIFDDGAETTEYEDEEEVLDEITDDVLDESSGNTKDAFAAADPFGSGPPPSPDLETDTETATTTTLSEDAQTSLLPSALRETHRLDFLLERDEASTANLAVSDEELTAVENDDEAVTLAVQAHMLTDMAALPASEKTAPSLTDETDLSGQDLEEVDPAEIADAREIEGSAVETLEFATAGDRPAASREAEVPWEAEDTSLESPAGSGPALDAVPNIDDELDEVEFFLSQELFDEARSVLNELRKKSPGDLRIIALDNQLRDQIGDQTDEAAAPSKARRKRTVPSRVETKRTTEGSVQFKNVGIKETLSDSDSATTWDLGLAYKEMGLFDDAIQAFEIAARDATKTALAKTMIGICYAALNRQDEAVQTFIDGLSIRGIDAHQKMGLLYELGKTYEMMQKMDKALDCFKDISGIDPTFADVAHRISALGVKKKSMNISS